MRSLSTSMARALKSARHPRKDKTNMASLFRNIPPKKLYLISVEAHCAKSLVNVGPAFMRRQRYTSFKSLI